jgi:hypothetical protein
VSYPKQLLRLQPKRGYISDTADHEASNDFWTRCLNVQFRDGFATKVSGFRAGYEAEVASIAPTAFFHAVNSYFKGVNWWLLFQKSGDAHAVQAGSAIQIDNGLLAAGADQPWEYSSALINGLPVVSNGANEPVYWPGSGLMQVLPGWSAGESCKFIAVLKYHIFAFDISGPSGSFEHLVKWSSATEPGAVPQEWTPTAENDAGDVLLSDTPGPILCAYPLGDALYVYKRTATYQIRYVGGQNVFSVRKVQSSSGALTPRSVCDIGGAHFIVSDGDIILNDGTTRRSVGESRIKDWLFGLLDVDQFLQLQCTYNRTYDEVVISFPSNNSIFCDTALVYDISQDSFGVRQLNQVTHVPVGLVQDTTPENVWANRTEIWLVATDVWGAPPGTAAVDSLITLTETVFTVEDVNNGVEFDAVIGRSGLTFGEPERIKFVKRVHLRTKETFGNLYVRVGGSMQPNSQIIWSSEVLVTGDQQVINCFAVGRYIAVEIRAEDGVTWKITGVDLEAEMRGYF